MSRTTRLGLKRFKLTEGNLRELRSIVDGGADLHIPQAFVCSTRDLGLNLFKKVTQGQRYLAAGHAASLAVLVGSLPIITTSVTNPTNLAIAAGVLTGIFTAVTDLANQGHKIRQNRHEAEKLARTYYDDNINDYMRFLRGYTDVGLVKRRLLDGCVEKIEAKGKLTLQELAKLVTFEEGELRDLKDNALAATIMQARAMVAIQNGEVKPHRIKTLGNLPLSRDVVISPGESRYLEMLFLKAALFDQWKNIERIDTLDEDELEPADFQDPLSESGFEINSLDKTKPFSVKSAFDRLIRFYEEGFSAYSHAPIPTATELFGERPKVIPAPVIDFVPDLAERIKSYNRTQEPIRIWICPL